MVTLAMPNKPNPDAPNPSIVLVAQRTFRNFVCPRCGVPNYVENWNSVEEIPQQPFVFCSACLHVYNPISMVELRPTKPQSSFPLSDGSQDIPNNWP